MRHTDLPHSCEDDDSDGDCIPCVAASGDVNFDCRCGECYRRLLIEVLVEDALVEPKIAEKGSPLLDPPDASGHWEVIGYLLNGKDGPCVFLEPLSNLCTIYATPPMVCRLVDFRRRP